MKARDEEYLMIKAPVGSLRDARLLIKVYAAQRGIRMHEALTELVVAGTEALTLLRH